MVCIQIVMKSIVFLGLGFDVRLLNIVEFSIKLGLVIDHILDIGIDLFGYILVFILSPSEQQISSLYLVSFGHEIFSFVVLGEQVVLEWEEDDDEEEEILGPTFHEDLPRVDHIGWIGAKLPMLVTMER